MKSTKKRIARAKKNVNSTGLFRSTDLWVMGPTRYLCATVLIISRHVDT